MSYQLYKLLHVGGVMLLFIALGSSILLAALGAADPQRWRKLAGITHGVALLLILVTGFGILAKTGLGFPGWVWAKLVVWLLIGASVAAIRRLPEHATLFFFLLPVLGTIAGYLGIYKPDF